MTILDINAKIEDKSHHVSITIIRLLTSPMPIEPSMSSIVWALFARQISPDGPLVCKVTDDQILKNGTTTPLARKYQPWLLPSFVQEVKVAADG